MSTIKHRDLIADAAVSRDGLRALLPAMPDNELVG